nr:unnamed protein product [Callosobruchus analis]
MMMNIPLRSIPRFIEPLFVINVEQLFSEKHICLTISSHIHQKSGFHVKSVENSSNTEVGCVCMKQFI